VPELPDLHYIVKNLAPRVTDRTITRVTIREPIVIRMLLPNAGGFADALPGRTIQGLQRRGPFLHFRLSGAADLIVHNMLAGRLQISEASVKAVPHLCFALALDSGEVLRYGDEKKMGKVYLTPAGAWEAVPGFREQGVDILSPEFTEEKFLAIMGKRRHQVRVFLMDQAALSAIGNAYADEILFAARIHPKTPCSTLSAEERRTLYQSIRSVMAWGISEVEKAAQPIEVKVRDHVKVRNRKDQPCPVCGTKIRRAGVLGYDSFFCPHCQAASRPQRIPW
jgi:formamidopyrimidine-DNA glycosylase